MTVFAVLMVLSVLQSALLVLQNAGPRGNRDGFDGLVV